MEPQAYYPTPQPANSTGKHLGPKKDRKPLIIIILSIIVIILITGFIWALMNYMEQKNNVDGIVGEAVEKGKAEQKEQSEVAFQRERDALHYDFRTDANIANVAFKYPRDWSQYIEQNVTSKDQISAIFHPGFVQKGDPGTYALRFQLKQTLYADVLKDYQRAIERGELSASNIKNGQVEGVRLAGKIDRDHNGVVVLFPIRDKTILLSTESPDYTGVFDEVLKSLSFTP